MTSTLTRAGVAVSLIAFLAACDQGMGTGTPPMDTGQSVAPVEQIAEPTDPVADNEIID